MQFLSALHLEARLVDGHHNFKGRLEVRKPGEDWGTVCENNFFSKDARVVCKMLGINYTRTGAYRFAHFGQGTGDIHMTNVFCTGEETNLGACPSDKLWGEAGRLSICSHSQDVSVNCHGNEVL